MIKNKGRPLFTSQLFLFTTDKCHDVMAFINYYYNLQ